MNLFLDNVSKESIGDNIKLTSTESLELGYEIASLENEADRVCNDFSCFSTALNMYSNEKKDYEVAIESIALALNTDTVTALSFTKKLGKGLKTALDIYVASVNELVNKLIELGKVIWLKVHQFIVNRITKDKVLELYKKLSNAKEFNKDKLDKVARKYPVLIGGYPIADTVGMSITEMVGYFNKKAIPLKDLHLEKRSFTGKVTDDKLCIVTDFNNNKLEVLMDTGINSNLGFKIVNFYNVNISKEHIDKIAEDFKKSPLASLPKRDTFLHMVNESKNISSETLKRLKKVTKEIWDEYKNDKGFKYTNMHIDYAAYSKTIFKSANAKFRTIRYRYAIIKGIVNSISETKDGTKVNTDNTVHAK